jgi:hypothetical protein
MNLVLHEQLAQALEPPPMEKVFAELMAERMKDKERVYGPLSERFPEIVHAIDTAISRLDEYISTGNTAHLIDAANFIMIEFNLPSHPIAHMRPLGPEDTPEQVLRDGTSN